MVTKSTLIRQMKRVAQDVTIIDRTETEDSYGRKSDITETSRTIKAFIDYASKDSLQGVSGGSQESATANMFADSDEVLKISPPSLVRDKYGDTWIVKGQGQPIQNSANVDIFRQWSLTLVESNGTS